MRHTIHLSKCIKHTKVTITIWKALFECIMSYVHNITHRFSFIWVLFMKYLYVVWLGMSRVNSLPRLSNSVFGFFYFTLVNMTFVNFVSLQSKIFWWWGKVELYLGRLGSRVGYGSNSGWPIPISMTQWTLNVWWPSNSIGMYVVFMTMSFWVNASREIRISIQCKIYEWKFWNAAKMSKKKLVYVVLSVYTSFWYYVIMPAISVNLFQKIL